MDGHDEGRIRIFGPAPSRKTLEIKSSRTSRQSTVEVRFVVCRCNCSYSQDNLIG